MKQPTQNPLIGKTGLLSVECANEQAFGTHVKILDVRRMFGRDDYLVQSTDGDKRSAWVSSTKVTLQT